jgi:drug/metabolite transporter (DMT)-like permease
LTNFTKLSPSLQGAIWTLGSAIFFVAMTVFVRQLGQNTSVPTMIFWRALAGLVASIPLVIGKPTSIWKIKRPARFLFRVSTSAAAFFASFYAFAHLPIAQAQAISFSRTLFITVLAVFFLKEKVAWRRWSAVLIGFIGVLLMSRSEANVLNFATLMAILAAALYALSIIMIKELTKDHDPATLVIYANIFTTLVGLPFYFFGGENPDFSQMIILLIMGFCGVGAQMCYVKALSIGDASMMAIVDYSRLPMSALAGFIIFHEILDNITLLGAALVIGSTIYITLREAKIGTTKPPTV